jgi:hypothetical protein
MPAKCRPHILEALRIPIRRAAEVKVSGASNKKAVIGGKFMKGIK